MFKIVEIVKNTCVKRYKRALMLQWSQTLCSDSQKWLHFPITNQFSFWWYAGIMPYSLLFQAFCTLTSIGLQRFLLKSGRSLWKHETIQSFEVVLHNRPATFKRSYTHKLSYYNSVVSCWTITCMQGAGPGSETTGKVTGCKQWGRATQIHSNC